MKRLSLFSRHIMRIVLAFIFLINTLLVTASPKAKEFSELLSLTYLIENQYDRNVLAYVFGLGEATIASNVVAEVDGQDIKICRPDQLQMSAPEYLKILQVFYVSNGKEDMAPPIAMILALRAIFPCK